MAFRLDIRVGGVVLEAPDAESFEELEAARNEAQTAARALAAERVANGRLLDGDAILICEIDGTVVDEVPLADMIRY